MTSNLESWRRAAYNAEECLAGCLASPEIAKHLDQATARTILERLSQARMEMLSASEAAQGEPVYQLRNTVIKGQWREADRVAYDNAAGLSAYERRVLWTAPPVAAGEPVATWVALTAAGQLRKGDKIRFRFGQETLTETVALVLEAGTEREEIVYNRKRNFYFITSKALAGTSSAKEVEVLRTVSAPPAAAHGDEAVRKDAEAAYIEMTCQPVLIDGAHHYYLSSERMQAFDRLFSVDVSDAAMRAQGDGGSGDA